MSCWLWHKLYGQTFLCLCLKYSTSNREGAGKIVIQVVIIITEKPPALSHFIPPDIFFTALPLHSSDQGPSAFNTLPVRQLGSFYKRTGSYPTAYPNPPSQQGYVEALSYMIASLRLQISYQLFFAALLLWVCENAQLILCCLTPCHYFCTTPHSLVGPTHPWVVSGMMWWPRRSAVM